MMGGGAARVGAIEDSREGLVEGAPRGPPFRSLLAESSAYPSPPRWAEPPPAGVLEAKKDLLEAKKNPLEAKKNH